MLGSLICLAGPGRGTTRAANSDLAELWTERVKTVVAVEFFTETEVERQSSQTFGTVVDENGTIIIPSQSIGDRVARDQLRDFRVYMPGASTAHAYPARYLGHDELTGWEFIQVMDTKATEQMVPITRFRASGVPTVTQELWGIGLKKKDENFAPYFMTSRVSILQHLPQHTALAAQEITGLGLPVFDQNGAFAGLGIGGFGQTFLQFSGRDRGGLPVVMINPDECAAVLLAEEVLPYLKRVPQNLNGRPLPWLGSNGLQPLDPEVARFLHLDNQAGLVVSEVLEGSPAAIAGLRERDIVLSINGEPLPDLRPDRVLITYFQREVNRRSPGDTMQLGILRDGQKMELKAVLTDAPELPRETARRFFEDLRFTVRKFTYVDAIVRGLKVADQRGVIVDYVNPGAPVGLAGLRQDDWIKEIDETDLDGFATAVKVLDAIEADHDRKEFSILIDRGGEDSVLRVKLH
ncbi:MAG: PDZ domain-containing protein [Cephaloticoccus sp.]|nr:PDZ domain-containing protein [Cephaloticoccus sp.]MCF7760018.1 PDZ domain-containing protein [Cephaloticoccus sp.]